MLFERRNANKSFIGLQTSRVWFGFFILTLFAIQGGALHLMGRPMFCKCAEIRLWSGNVLSSQTSQQVSDWYSFTHVEHGLISYFIAWLVLPTVSVVSRFLVGLTAEIGWELLENTPFFVQLYRRQALALGYEGDSILNSISDVGFAALGFFIAAAAPVWAALALMAIIELTLLYSIRDSLTLNVLGFFYKFDFLSRWQSKLS